MTEIQGKLILVRVSARFELTRVRVIGSRLYLLVCLSLFTEMPTSRDLKSGDSLFFSSSLPRKFRTLYQVLHEVDTIQIRDHRFDARNNLCQ